jgi:O-antigen/teichoic acid export membrane protein
MVAVSKISQSVVTSLTSLGYGMYIPNVAGLIYSTLFGQAVSTTVLAGQNYRELKSFKNEISINKIKSVGKKFIDFPKFSVITALLDTISMQLPIIMITSYFSSYKVGLYSMAFKVLSVPLSLIGASIAQVFYQKLSDTVNKGENPGKLIYKTWKSLFLQGIIPFSLILIFGGQLFSLVFGSKWEEAGIMAATISPLIFALFISSPTSTAYLVLRMQKIALIFPVISIIFRITSLYIGYHQNDIILGLRLMVAFEIVQIIISNLIIIKIIKRFNKISN